MNVGIDIGKIRIAFSWSNIPRIRGTSKLLMKSILRSVKWSINRICFEFRVYSGVYKLVANSEYMNSFLVCVGSLGTWGPQTTDTQKETVFLILKGGNYDPPYWVQCSIKGVFFTILY